jgi:hypothetical protein
MPVVKVRVRKPSVPVVDVRVRKPSVPVVDARVTRPSVRMIDIRVRRPSMPVVVEEGPACMPIGVVKGYIYAQRARGRGGMYIPSIRGMVVGGSRRVYMPGMPMVEGIEVRVSMHGVCDGS